MTSALVPLEALLDLPAHARLLGLDLAMSATGLMLRLLMIIGIPALAAFALRRWLGQARLDRAAKPLDGAVVFVLVFFAFGEQQERLNKIIQDRVTLRVAVDTGADVAERLTQLVRELRKYQKAPEK